jgi:hypothetical protein
MTQVDRQDISRCLNVSGKLGASAMNAVQAHTIMMTRHLMLNFLAFFNAHACEIKQPLLNDR